MTRVVTSQFEIPRAPPPRKYPGHKNRTSNACYHSFSIFTVIFPLFWCRHLAQSLWWWYSRDFAVMHNLILVFSKHFQNSEQKFQTNPLLFRSNGSGLISDVNWGQGSSENLKRKEEKMRQPTWDRSTCTCLLLDRTFCNVRCWKGATPLSLGESEQSGKEI